MDKNLVNISVMKSQDGKVCVAINDRRVAGVKPHLSAGNIVGEWEIPISDIARALGLEEMLWLPCCHTSGMHDPVHFQERRYVCNDQKAHALERFCKVLGINPLTKSDPNCGWCRDYPEKKKGEDVGLFDETKK